MHFSKKPAFAIGLLTSLLLVTVAVFAWTGPTGDAPTSNVPAPISAISDQYKTGSLTVEGLLELEGGIKASHSTENRPACSSSTRGMLFMVHGEAGEKDRKFVCYYDNGNYHWEQTSPDWREEASQTIKEGLVGHWTFNEGHGKTANDYSTNNNHGTLNHNYVTQSPWQSIGDGHALEFDGVNDYVQIPHNSSLNVVNGITLSSWVKLNSIGGDSQYQRIIDKSWNSYSLVIWTNEKVNFNIEGMPESAWSNSLLNIDRWYHVVGSWDTSSGYWFIMIDGIIDNEGVSVGSFNHNTKSLYIGRHQSTNDQNIDGFLDDVRIYNRALRPEEIRYIYETTFRE